MSAWRSLSALAPGLALAAAPSFAAASPAYSTQLAQRVGRTTEPPCGVCHAADPAADVAAMAPFGQALRDRGFTDGTNLIAAFDRLASERVDSDGDRSTDADELSWGGDPNVYDGVRGDPVPEVEPGFCGVGPAPGAPSSGARLLAAAGLAVVVAFRRKAKRPLGQSAARTELRGSQSAARIEVRGSQFALKRPSKPAPRWGRAPARRRDAVADAPKEPCPRRGGGLCSPDRAEALRHEPKLAALYFRAGQR